MKSLFFDTRVLDAKAKDEFALSDDVLMENAAAALEERIETYCIDKCNKSAAKILIVCGSGDNGGDGLALARRLLNKSFNGVFAEPLVFQVLKPKSANCIRQFERAEKVGVQFINALCEADVIVDCLFGSGFKGLLAPEMEDLINALNSFSAFKIACDVPSALDCAIKNEGPAFVADETVTMGAGKISLFVDNAKDYAGTVYTASLGISSFVFEKSFNPDAMLLEECDLKLPSRNVQNVNKGSFGHVSIPCGTKTGAAVIASKAAFMFGAGLSSIILPDFESSDINLPCEIMCFKEVPQNANSMAIGMGLGRNENDFEPYISLMKNAEMPFVFDADVFYCRKLKEILDSRNQKDVKTVLTPHPKEFANMLEILQIASISAAEIQKDRLKFADVFCKLYKNIVLILKGSVPVIAFYDFSLERTMFYLNPLGNANLAKGGSGDVLAGLTAALLAQGFSAKASAIQASLAHSAASKLAAEKYSSYALTPEILIEAVAQLEHYEKKIHKGE